MVLPSDSRAADRPAAPALVQADAAVVLSGQWNAAHLAQPRVFRQIQRDLQRQASGRQADGWNLSAVQGLDHLAAQLLWNHWGRQWPAQLQATEAQRAVLQRVAGLAEPAAAPKPPTWHDRYLQLGQWVVQGLAQTRELTALIGQLALDSLRLMRRPQDGPWRDISGHLYRMGATALPITAMVGFLIGVVLAYLMSQQLRQFGAEAFIVNILGLSLIRELGPMLAAVLIAGRSGSAITAQIGVMRVTEELDAMRVMGIAHGFRLVMPRALALALAMPLLSLWTITASLLGGMVASDLSLGITPAYFLSALPKAVQFSNLVLALGKSVVFGITIALVGAHFGLRVKPDTESLGRGTTASVVTSITMVIVINAVFAVMFRSVGL